VIGDDTRPLFDAALAVPRATYRLQLSRRFTFADAQTIVPYLASLGISHVYASSFLKARPGSDHGYDITDHNALNPEIGDWAAFVAFSDELRAHDMGLILDFVPNHMGIGRADNAWWLDVLEWGQTSPYSDYFDIDWTPSKPELKGKVLLPLLGDHYGSILRNGEFVLKFDAGDGSLSVWYHDHRFPLRPRSYAVVIRRATESTDAPQASDTLAAVAALANEFDRIRRTALRRRDEARAHFSALKRELAALCGRNAEAAIIMNKSVAAFQGTAVRPSSFRLLHTLLEQQHYRAAFWRVASDEINYRRFFDINELAGIRIENRALFDVAHELVGRMIAEGRLHGLRLDHIDGLFDPDTYCRRLQAFARARRAAAGGDENSPFYVVIEKILARHEPLREEWPIAGTTGYEFTNLVNGLFIESENEGALDAIYREFAGETASFDSILLSAKNAVAATLLSGELNVLANELDRISERHWGTRDYTLQRLREALREVVLHFPVYRTYVTKRGASDEDRRDIDWAVAQARRSWRGPDHELFDFIHAALTGELAERGARFPRSDVLRFAMRFQQYTGPIMAKSLEDTAFYRYHKLVSLNEVGGDPRQFGVSVAAFDYANRQRARQWPSSMLTTSTHDTKRGEDSRLRIDVLSEIPAAWRNRIDRWSTLNQSLRREVGGNSVPSAKDEYLLYQALLGAWPFVTSDPLADEQALRRFAARYDKYIVKALREAKILTDWASPNEAYEDAFLLFIGGMLDPRRPFLTDFCPFARRVAWFGMLNSLSQTILRTTAPGIPDAYQGSELWDLSFVDPDNRSPVDFDLRHALLHRAQFETTTDARRAAYARECLTSWQDGRVKLHALSTALACRKRWNSLFLEGSYQPLEVKGRHAKNVVAFAREWRGQTIVVVTGRLFVSLLGEDAKEYVEPGSWGDTMIGGQRLEGHWREAITGASILANDGQVPLLSLIGHFPAAILHPA